MYCYCVVVAACEALPNQNAPPVPIPPHPTAPPTPPHIPVCCSAIFTHVHTQGSILRFDCTFDLDDVVEEMEVDQSFRIQSVSVIPKHANGNSDSVYAADASNLDEVRGEVRMCTMS